MNFLLAASVLAILPATSVAFFECGIIGDACQAMQCGVGQLDTGNSCSGTQSCCRADPNFTPPPPTTSTTTPPSTQPTPSTAPPPLPPPECGARQFQSSRIINGTESGACEWPFVVSIRKRNDDTKPIDYENSEASCQGVILDHNHILTTGVCVALTVFGKAGSLEDNLLVIAGEQNVAKLDLKGVGIYESFHFVEKVTYHPDFMGSSNPNFFDGTLGDNNLAVIKLALPIVLGDCRSKICLTSADDSSETFNAKTAKIVSWGLAEDSPDSLSKLRQSDGNILSPFICDFLFPGGPIALGGCGQFLTEYNAVCRGDNGAMVITETQDANSQTVWKLYGLISIPNIGTVAPSPACLPAGNNAIMTVDINLPATKLWINWVLNPPSPLAP